MTSPKPVHLFFCRYGTDFLSPCIKKILLGDDFERNFIICENWNELVEKITLRPRSISIYIGEVTDIPLAETIDMVKTLSKLVCVDQSYQLSISIGIRKTTSYKKIKELQKNDISGIIPNHRDFGIEETLKGLRAQWSNIPYWPKHIINQLSGSPTQKDSTPPTVDDIKLTVRQQQIVNMIVEKGASNKVIARLLNISESTVKLHLGHIFKKYGVKSRTQLAVFGR